MMSDKTLSYGRRETEVSFCVGQCCRLMEVSGSPMLGGVAWSSLGVAARAGMVVVTGSGARRDPVVSAVSVMVVVVAGLTFLFGFGNVLVLALRLGVPVWVAPLVAPAVHLTVVALLVAVRRLSACGASLAVCASVAARCECGDVGVERGRAVCCW